MPDSFEKKRTQDRMSGPEALGDMHISVIGAQGHFGSHLVPHLQEIMPHGVTIEPIVERERNKEAAFRSDMIILAVQPGQMQLTLALLKEGINADARVLSFAARVPLEDIVKSINLPAARMMADPWWNVSAYVLGEGFVKDRCEFIFNYLTEMKPVQLPDNAAIERFTLLLCQLFVAVLLERAGELETAAPHVRFVAAQKEFNCDPEMLAHIKTGPDAVASLRMFATPKGISERFRDALRADTRIEPEALLKTISDSLARKG
jgi:hypothetical protein